MDDIIQKIEWSKWKCINVSPNEEARDDWEWRKKYEGLVGHVVVYDYRAIYEDYRVKFITDDTKGFVTKAKELAIDDDILTVTTPRSIYTFKKEG